MTSHEIGQQLGKLILEERCTTKAILEIINLALGKRAYLELGFSSMFDWLVKGFGYSNAAAYRRIEAAKLLKAVPEVSEKLSAGLVNLSTLSKAHTMIRAQEKVSKVTNEVKAEIVRKIENKSVQETEQVLMAAFPAVASHVHQERRTTVNETTVRHAMNFSIEESQDLKRAKEVLSHQLPNASDAQILAYALNFLLDHVDPLRKQTKPTKATSQAGTRRAVIKSSGSSCTYKDPVTGQVCGSRYQVQIDHIIPKALGGSDEPSNLRTLCRQHNLLMAEREFGKEMMDHYRVQK
jgi:hypothetical protein